MKDFWSKVEVLPWVDACWNWKLKGRINGYGIYHSKNPKHQWLAHRYAYTITYGDIPGDLTIDHACFNRECVNPNHLYLATRGDNVRLWIQDLTHCPQGHEYTEANTRKELNSGKWIVRHCKKCHAIQEANRRRKKKEKSVEAIL